MIHHLLAALGVLGGFVAIVCLWVFGLIWLIENRPRIALAIIALTVHAVLFSAAYRVTA